MAVFVDVDEVIARLKCGAVVTHIENRDSFNESSVQGGGWVKSCPRSYQNRRALSTFAKQRHRKCVSRHSRHGVLVRHNLDVEIAEDLGDHSAQNRIVQDDSPRFCQRIPPDHERIGFDRFEKGAPQRQLWIRVAGATFGKGGQKGNFVFKLHARKQTLRWNADILAGFEKRWTPYPADPVVGGDAAKNYLSAHFLVVLIAEDIDQFPWHHIRFGLQIVIARPKQPFSDCGRGRNKRIALDTLTEKPDECFFPVDAVTRQVILNFRLSAQ